MNPRPFPADAITELRFALAESDSDAPEAEMRERVLRTAMKARTPGWPVDPAFHVDGLTAFRRMTARLAQLLGALRDAEWAQTTIRDLTVQVLVGHLIVVEEGFCATLAGHGLRGHRTRRRHAGLRPGSEGAAAGRNGREMGRRSETNDRRRVGRGRSGPRRAFSPLSLPLDPFLIVRAFEM